MWSTINSVNVLPAIAVTSNEIFELTDDDHRDISNACNVEASDEPIVHGQIDIGCSASCTGNREMSHDHAKFGPGNPSPTRLSPATDGSDALPEGWGCSKVPAHNEVGYLKARTHYHPKLRATLFDERDFCKAAGHTSRGTKSELACKCNQSGTCICKAEHTKKSMCIVTALWSHVKRVSIVF